MSAGRLDFGALDLVTRDGQVGQFRFRVWPDGFTPGSPEAVRAVVETLLRDGQFSATTRHSNRTVQFRVLIEATDSLALAEGERLLGLECAKRSTTLTWTPPDGFGPPSVFEVVGASMVQEFSNVDELMTRRTFAVTLECLPFVRSVSPVSFTHTTGRTLLTDCAAMTGWTVLTGSASSNGFDIVTGTGVASSLRYQPTVPLEEYVEVDFDNPNLVTSIAVGGVDVPRAQWRVAANLVYVPTGTHRGTAATVTIAVSTNVTIRNLDTVSYPAAAHTFTVADRIGSARAPLALKAWRSAGALGDVFICTTPDPNALLQRGVPHALFGTVTVTGGGIAGNGEGGVVTVAGVPKWFPTGTHHDTLGVSQSQPKFTDRRLYQPTVTPTTTAPTSGTVTLGTTYQYPTDRDVAVVFVKGVTQKGLWIFPPSPEMPEGGIFGGDTEDGTGAVALLDEVKVYSPLAIHPDRSGLVAVAANAGAVWSGTYHPRWLNNAGQ